MEALLWVFFLWIGIVDDGSIWMIFPCRRHAFGLSEANGFGALLEKASGEALLLLYGPGIRAKYDRDGLVEGSGVGFWKLTASLCTFASGKVSCKCHLHLPHIYHQMKMIWHQAPGKNICIRKEVCADFLQEKQVVVA